MFYVIAVSETWLKEKEADVELEGYELFTVNRVNKKGGGVALYVSSDFKCNIVDGMSTSIDNIMECVT